MKPRILVVGAGSIGSRHARNLEALGADVTVMDPAPGRALAAGAGRPAPLELDAASAHDAVVLASPTIHHADQLAHVLPLTPRVFVEKPMVLAPDELSVVDGHEDRIMVGYNLRFHDPLVQTRKLMIDGAAGQLVGGRFWFGSWLPDWRPSVDYRLTYSARADLGGGVLMDAIHELDLALWFFGRDLEVVGAVVARIGPLDIDVEDTVRALLLSDGRVPVELSLDLLSRRYRRGVELIGTEATIRYDWDRGEIELDTASGRQVIQADRPAAHSYEEQAARLLDWVGGGPPLPVDGLVGAASVRLAHQIEERAWTTKR